MRKEAAALQAPPTEPIRHWTQGLAELVRAIQGNREADFARQQELSGRQQGADAISQIYAPYLSPGGGASPAAAPRGAAPVGTLGSDPAGAMPSTTTTTADASAPVPRGIRNNNPLNIEDGPFAQGQPGYAGTDGRFARFASSDNGTSAANSLLDIYNTKHGLNTVAGIIGRWAPSADGNNVQAYATDVASKLGIGPNDPIPPAMRPQLIAAMAGHENGVPFPVPKAGPAGLLAPISPSPAAPKPDMPPPPPGPSTPQPNQPPVRVAYAGDTIPPGILPSKGGQVPNPRSVFETGAAPIPGMTSLVNAIAGRPPVAAAPPPAPPAPGEVPDFAKQAAILAAQSDRGPSVPLAPDQAAALTPQPPAPVNPNLAAQVAALAPTMDRGPAVPLPPGATNLPGFPPAPPAASPTPAAPPPPAVATAAPPAGPVPTPVPRPQVPLDTGSAIPGAVGPTSVNGAPLVPPPTAALPPAVGSVSVNGKPLLQPGAPENAALVSAIAGRPSPTPVSLPGAAPSVGAPNQPAPIRVAQNGAPTSAAPMAPGGPAGLPQPLTSATGQISQDQLTRVLANPWVPEQAKAAMLQMIQQRGQPQTMPVEGGTLMYNSAGQRVFIPEPKFGTVKIGSAEVPTVSHFDPGTGRWNTQTLAPGGGVQTGGGPPGAHPAQAQEGGTDLSSIAAIQAEEARQAGAKKAAETAGETGAKYYDSLHKGLTGSGMISAQQKQNIDLLRQVAASPDFTPGPAGDLALAYQRMAAGLGINPEGAAPRELFNQVATRILADQISGIKSMASETGETGGRIFKSMIEMEEKANITPEDSAAGINAKLNLIDTAGNLMMKWADMADDYASKHGGRLDAGFDKELRAEIGKARIPNAVPQAPGGGQPPPSPPSPDAINYLKSHPELRDQFDTKYGAGSAATVLGQ